MANKRQLKKSINNACGDLAYALFLTECVAKESNEEKALEILNAAAQLQANALAKVSISFDKTPRNFENKRQYHKAHKQYFSKAFNELQDEFVTKLQTIVDEVNKLLNAE